LSTYVQAVPGTIGLICAITPKGEDNKLKFMGSRSELISEFGEPNIAKYGKNYSQGLYCAYNYLGESGSLYFMRCLPTDATYSNMRLDVSFGAADATASVLISYIDSLNSESEIKTNLESSAPTYPIGMLYPIGRGEYYNGLGVRFTEHSNPLISGVYVMDVYEKQSDGDEVIIESFEISLDPLARDSAGDSIFIANILELYSAVLRFDMKLSSGDWTDGYSMIGRTFDQQIGTVSLVGTPGAASLTDTKQVFSDWETDPETGNSAFCIVAKDAKGNKIRGWLGASGGSDEDTVNVFNGRDLDTASQTWQLYNASAGTWGDWDGSSTFDSASEIIYEVKRTFANLATAFTNSDPVPLKKGSDGGLLNSVGDVVAATATQLLAQGYAGTLDDTVLDIDNMYFSLVFDCGYPSDVKTQISSLVQTRRDCVAIMDNGDNPSYSASMVSRDNSNTFNNYFCALYESYNKVYDIFTGQDMWVSPIYHMSYIIPRNDVVGEVWTAPAGFARASIDSIKELRFNPRLGQRDQMYLNQLNPIVKFSEGYVVWGQLTTQTKASALSDLNIVRLILYIKRALERYCRGFIFELNDAVTWDNVSSDIVSFLSDVKSARGLYGFSVEVGATEYELKSKTFHVHVTLNPTRVVEKIELNFFIV